VKTRILLTIGTCALFATTFVHAADTLVKGNIPFEFHAGSKVLPAGQYEFTSDDSRRTVTLHGAPAGSSAVVLVLTRLAAGIHTTPADSHIVFDKVGETYTLSEIWVAGMDGFLMNIVKTKHEHKIIDVPR
jgi:hypothetical protein